MSLRNKNRVDMSLRVSNHDWKVPALNLNTVMTPKVEVPNSIRYNNLNRSIGKSHALSKHNYFRFLKPSQGHKTKR